MTQENRISAFIDSLEGTGMTDGSDAILLTSDMNAIGGDNGGNCENYLPVACSNVTNKGNCVNQGVCAGADNKKSCKNLPPITPDPPVEDIYE